MSQRHLRRNGIGIAICLTAAAAGIACDPPVDEETAPKIVRESKVDFLRRVEELRTAPAETLLQVRARPIRPDELSRLRGKPLNEVPSLSVVDTIVVPYQAVNQDFDLTDEQIVALYRTAVVEPIPEGFHLAPWTVLTLRLRKNDRPARLWLMLAGVGRLERPDGTSIPLRYTLDDQP
ncbi:MAG: hypothetical protein WBC44_20530 [Planctomycetaceae bacterium]